jgi:hypothetical protein
MMINDLVTGRVMMVNVLVGSAMMTKTPSTSSEFRAVSWDTCRRSAQDGKKSFTPAANKLLCSTAPIRATYPSQPISTHKRSSN